MNSNKLIAEFMGDIPKYVIGHGKAYDKYNDYSKSWDLLMPVVREVIIRHQVDEGIEIDYDELQNRVMDNDIERAYEEVVEFIKEYNDKQG